MPKLVKRDIPEGGASYVFWCPGCKEGHSFVCGRPGGVPNWNFNGNFESPTFTPSLLIYTTHPRKGPDGMPLWDERPWTERRTICHLIMTDGRISFCGDCPHELVNKVVDLPNIPDDYGV